MKMLTTRAFWRVVTTTTVVCLSAATVAAYPDTSPLPQPPGAASSALPVANARYKTVSHTIEDGETARSALAAMGAPVEAILQGAGSALNRIYAGDTLALDYEVGKTQPFRLRFVNDDPVVKALEWNGDRYELHTYPIAYKVEAGVVGMTITSSLWAAAESAGLRPGQIMGLARIFDTEVDFNTELEEGAQIKLVADRLVDEAGNVRLGDIRGAMLKNGKNTYTFIRYRGADGRDDWYEPNGDGRKRPFLRSPLEFSRVTSGFSTGRYHPILHRMRAHVGVDLAAATGTPVRAVADGVVIFSGVHGGHGNFVELDHEGPYGTSYAHLSAILVKRGQKVHQGDVIGRVGATGLATGPHLHYQMTLGGKYVDPMKVALPMTGGMQGVDLAGFRKVRDEVVAQLQKD